MAREEDPLLINARREALLVLATWIIAGTFSVSYCYLYGYGLTPEQLHFTLGFPSWILYGVVIPWVTWAILSFVISTFVMQGDALGAEAGDSLAGEDFDEL
ncbi:conserved hypothetical protein [Pirellula staleyi DSM 6068]|uniref:Uncharacterized protein n=1 Tax=Pirellula staleyi (strain ATCC 27377 / DSM 6068 / ICPB 4128) TaxID=530564 RepID=D2R7M4_PIRSD|nr:conserved hypothetical protein [Pirellula staleyi DSM 6068]